MADNSTTTLASNLWEMQGAVQQLFATESVFLAELNGVGNTDGKVGRYTRAMDQNRDVFHGSQVRFPLVPYGLNGGGFVTETGTWNVPHALTMAQATMTLKDTVVPFSVSVDAERDSQNGGGSMEAVGLLVDQARIQLAKIENIAALNSGNLVAQVASSSGSAGLTVPVTAVNWNIVLPGTVWDVLTRSSGADPGSGLRRLVSSVTRTTDTTGNVVFSTTSQASDGGSGNITFSANEGLYIPGSWSASPPTSTSVGINSLDDAAAITGTFEGIAKGTYAYWQGTDGREGVTTSLPLSDTMLDLAVTVARRYGNGVWDFGIGDQRCINLYKQGKASQVQFDTSSATLTSGFQGVVYQGADKPFPIIAEPHHKRGSVRLIKKEHIQLYGDAVGPEFLNDDGSMFRRFSRALPKEADLVDRWNIAWKSCNSCVFIDNLASS